MRSCGRGRRSGLDGVTGLAEGGRANQRQLDGDARLGAAENTCSCPEEVAAGAGDRRDARGQRGAPRGRWPGGCHSGRVAAVTLVVSYELLMMIIRSAAGPPEQSAPAPARRTTCGRSGCSLQEPQRIDMRAGWIERTPRPGVGECAANRQACAELPGGEPHSRALQWPLSCWRRRAPLGPSESPAWPARSHRSYSWTSGPAGAPVGGAARSASSQAGWRSWPGAAPW